MTPDPATALPSVYARLVDSPNRATDRALVAALPRSEDEYQGFALEVLLQRGREPVLAQLVAGFESFAEPLQARIISSAARLSAGARVAIGAEDLDTRAAAIAFIRRSGSSQLAYLLAGALSQRCPKTRALAGEALNHLVARHRKLERADSSATPAGTLTRQRQQLASAIRQALSCWEVHFRTEIVTAAMWLADELEEEIISRVAEPRSKLAHAFDEMLGAAPGPDKAGYLLRALRSPTLRNKAARVLERCKDDATMAAVLDESWVLADPELSKSLTRIRRLAWMDEGLEPLLVSNHRAMEAAAALVAASGMAGRTKASLLDRMACSGHPVLERAAVWRLVGLPSEAAIAPLRRLAERGPREWARVAERELWRRQRTLADAAKWPSGLGPAADEEELSTFDAFWDSYDDLPAPKRMHGGRELRNILPDFDSQLRWKLAASDPADRARGVRMVRALSLADDMREQLYVLAYDSDPLVRSAAVMALARVDNATTRRILWTALRDVDERVQANAIEALDGLEADQFRGDVQSKLQSPNNRIRANAIKSLLKLEIHEAADALLAMLDAESRAERLSALWVIECLQLQSLTDRLVEMAREDPDPRVRHRAVAIAGRIGVPIETAEPIKPTEVAPS